MAEERKPTDQDTLARIRDLVAEEKALRDRQRRALRETGADPETPACAAGPGRGLPQLADGLGQLDARFRCDRGGWRAQRVGSGRVSGPRRLASAAARAARPCRWAAVSAQVFDGVDTQLSQYAYLVSLLPPRVVDDLGAPVRLARRRYASYTPDPATAGRRGLLVGAQNTFAAIGAADDEPGFIAFYRRCRLVTERLWPTLLEPLRTRTQMHRHVLDGNRPEADAAWRAITEEPIGHAIAAAVGNDLVRGVIATDALIGTFAGVNDPSLRQNICLLYHLLGGGTGHWDVPVGGMGSVTAALAAAATSHGAEIVTGADVYAVDPEGEVWYRCGGEECRIRAESSWPASPRWCWPTCWASPGRHWPRAARSR
ncbi:hypothetical protein I553_4455 [Mycobacterium xenopi 4042]|uniref:Uncharacterized protein n=1 Tax=Mycobacterium xenopi 4042 TaxID=1299334 RepID=X8AGP6_MYCXE|nr:hypothetical protein I553_4455 [Mycobacterium xenopi 4042]